MKRRKVRKPLKTSQTKPSSGAPETVTFDQGKEVRAIARERLGRVKPSQTIVPKAERKKPKHKKSMDDEGQ